MSVVQQAEIVKRKMEPGALLCVECFEPVPKSDKERYDASGGLCVFCEVAKRRIRDRFKRERGY